VPYNGADGLPIREEIVSRHGETIITRNSYGARCLNSPNVLFADIDYASPAPCLLGCVIFLLLAAIAVVAAWHAGSWVLGIVLCFVALIVAVPIASVMHSQYLRTKGGIEETVRARIGRFGNRNPDWAIRVYRTPAGLRLLVTHRPFEPSDPAVQAFFANVGADPMYVRMCLNQQCFRARVSPKPWRIGISSHMRPRPGVWPVRPEQLAQRREWIEAYETTAIGFAACEFVESIGSGVVHPQIAPVVKLHDELSRANSGLPMA
jgi:hypothetical protein